MMTILYLTNIPAPYSIEFFNELGKYCDLTVVFERKFASDRDSSWKAVNINNFKSIYLQGIKIGNDSIFSFRIIQIIQKKYDIIIQGNYASPTGIISTLWMWLNKMKFVVSFDGAIIRKEFILRTWIKKFLLSKASYYLSTGKATDEYLMHYDVEYNQIYRYPISSLREKDIDKQVLDFEEKAKLRLSLGISESKVIIMAGQFIYRKGIDVLLKAAIILNDNSIGYYCIGGLPQPYLLRLSENRANIHFINFLSQLELMNYYHAGDLFVLPTREDIWGYVVHEALSRGLPVITTDRCNCGLALIENSKNGYIVNANKPEEIAKKIDLFFNINNKKQMAEYSIEVSKNYTIEKMVTSHIKIFDKILRS